MWDKAFVITNVLAMAGWLVLLLGPRTASTRRLVLMVPIALLCAIYASMLVGLSAGWVDPEASGTGGDGGLSALFANYTVDGLMALFQSRGAVVIGWTHYLAFDLMVGWWIAGDADGRGIPRWSQAGILVATLMAGPLGLIIYLMYRSARPEIENAAG